MVNPKRSRRRRRSRRNRRSAPKQGQVSKTSPRGLSKYSTARSFSLYPKQWEQATNSSWLDKLVSYGSIAMKIFTTLLASDHLSSTWCVTGTVQCIVLGVEDLLWSSPLKEDGFISASYSAGLGVATKFAPQVDYRQGKIDSLTVKITVGAENSKRAGRICMAVVSLTESESDAFKAAKKGIPIPSFDQLLLYPGAVTGPMTCGVLSRTWRPKSSDYGMSFKQIGQDVKPGDSNPPGGSPVVAVYVGYQDMASSNATPSTLYAPEEALFNLDIHGTVHCREWGTSWIRKWPITMKTDDVTMCFGRERFELDSSLLTLNDKGLLTANLSSLPPVIRRMIKSPDVDWSTHQLVLPTDEDFEDGEILSPSTLLEGLEMQDISK